ncbi:MAG: hypothetical protein PHH06_01905 [Candidatus Gracilibacteria bacterium]|nr:hypothetical protein [Candidatus Gracilibacteria bacterium]
MKKVTAILLLVFLIMPQILNGYNAFGIPTPFERKIVTLGDNTCKDIKETDIPTIFVPGILASWYSAEGYDDAKVKRWIPDPITHVYDPLFFTFKRAGYTIEDVFYKDEFNLEIKGNPKHSLYLFGYDWKKDNKITATLLTQLIGLILKEYEADNGCNIGKVNVIANSMGGLVARSMLEDICVDFKYKNGILDYSEFPRESVNGRIKNIHTIPCKNPFPTDTIGENIKVNKFITISTPQRGAPKALPIWEHGDIEMTDGFFQGIALKFESGLQFYLTDGNFYDLIHGYKDKVPNGIVTIGQLLPDLKNKNSYNEKLKYLYKDYPDVPTLTSSGDKKWYLDNKYYPTNNFLEELNKTENINKMWDKITDKYTSYYSMVTGNEGNNNIVEFDINDQIQYYTTMYGSTTKMVIKDNTYNIGNDVKDIYNYYEISSDRDKKNYYNINEVIRNNVGFGGDGTVPSYNLKLIPNDSIDGEEVNNDKFKSIRIDCADLSEKGKNYVLKNGTFLANPLYEDFGSDNIDFEICSHTNMPIATSKKVLDNIIGESSSVVSEYNSIVNNLGYTEYDQADINIINEGYIIYGPGSTSDRVETNYIEGEINYHGIYNYVSIDKYFDDERFIETDTKLVNNDFKYSLKMGGVFKKGYRLYKYQILSPINLLITDSQGRRIGIDPETGMIINEIPGAWTSGDTEDSNEPEFFLIPVEGTGAVEHEIKTYGTGDGEYHIVLNEVDLTTDKSLFSKGSTEEGGEGLGKLIIAGNAKQAFGEDYTVSIDETGDKTYTNLTANIPVTVEVENTNIKTDKTDYKLRYFVRGDSSEIDKLRYKLVYDPETSSGGQGGGSGGQVLLDKYINISGILNLNLKDTGKYKLVLELVDKEGNTLTNPEATKTIYIEKQDQKQSVTDRVKNTQDNTYPEKQESFSQLFDVDIHGVFNLYNNKNNYFDAKLGFGINSSFDAKMSYDEETGNVKVLLPNGGYSSFTLQSDFTYINDLENDLKLERILNYFKVTASDANYYFSPKNYLLQKLEKKDVLFEINYDRNDKLDFVSQDDKKIFSFNYDDYTGLLASIDDKYGNKIIFSYEKVDDTYVLSKINNNSILYNSDGDIKKLTDVLNVLFAGNTSYSKKLERIKQRIDAMKLSSYRKKKLLQTISEQKKVFLAKIKDDYTKSLFEYFIGEIEKYLKI